MGKIILLSIAASLILLLLSLLVVTSTPTSKVTWEDQRGFPLTFLVLGRYTGPCELADKCSRLFLETFDLRNFLLDSMIFLAAAGGFSYLGAILMGKRKFKAIVTGRR